WNGEFRFRFYACVDHRDLHSFPTRRSSDLEPLGFKIDDKKLRRSAVDYYDALNFEIHPDFDTFYKTHPGKYFFLSRYGSKIHSEDRKSTRLNSSHVKISYAVFCSKKKIMTK